MNCTQTQALLDDWLDAQVSTEEQVAIEGHLQACPVCRARLAQERQLRAALRSLPIEPPSPGFAARALRQARLHHRYRRGFAQGFASAAAAGLLLWLAATLLLPDIQLEQTPPGVTLAAGETRTVHLVFHVPHDMPTAQLDMRLPSRVELAGYPGQQELRWQTSLRAGQNLLSLPVVALGQVDGDLIAAIAIGDKHKTFRLRLQAAAQHDSRGPSDSLGAA